MADLDRVHRRPAPSQRLLGALGTADVRPPGAGRGTGRDPVVPGHLPAAVRPGTGLRCPPRAPDHGPELPGSAPGGRTGLPARTGGRARPHPALLDALVRDRGPGRSPVPGALAARSGTDVSLSQKPGFGLHRPGATGPAAAPGAGAPAGGQAVAGVAGDGEVLDPEARVDLADDEAAARVRAVLGQIDADLVGLTGVKQRLREIAALLMVDRARARFGLSASRPSLH